ncbi:MAG TPA: hypothetical protein VIX38_05770, partial [Nitrososphaeraceae archaeon]
YVNTSSPSPKPHNYFNELSPERQEEHRKLEAVITEAERYKKIGKDVEMFESFQRWLKIARPIPKVDPMPPGPRRRRIEESGPLLEEVMLARGLLHAVKKGGSDK